MAFDPIISKVQGKTFVAPVAGNDGQFVKWDNANAQFNYGTPAGGGGGSTVTTPFTFYAKNASGGDFRLAAANTITVQSFNLPYSMTVSAITLNVINPGAGNYDVGIYDTTGTLKGNTGTVTYGTAGAITIALIAPVTLTAGTYLLAFTGSAASVFWAADAGNAGAPCNLFCYSTATTSSGTLPSTITVATSFTGTAPSPAGGQDYTPVMVLT